MRKSSSCLAMLSVVIFVAVSASPALADWTAYAVDGRGKFGHGRAPTRAGAEDYALGYCGSYRCRIIMTSPARCVALATSDADGFRYGTGEGETSFEASHRAVRACYENGAPRHTCNVNHTYCQ